MKKIMIFGVPLLAFLVLVVFLFSGLFSDPRKLDSQVKGKPMPAFSLPDLMKPEKVVRDLDWLPAKKF